MRKRQTAAPHHSAPCQHPTADGLPCPNRAVDHDPQHGPICALHAHHRDTTEHRTACVMVRVSPTEHETISLAADTIGVSLSDLGRVMLLGLPMPQPPRPVIDVQTYGELGKIGGNLNQIARSLNSMLAGAPGEVDAPGLLAELGALREVIREVRLGLVGEP